MNVFLGRVALSCQRSRLIPHRVLSSRDSRFRTHHDNCQEDDPSSNSKEDVIDFALKELVASKQAGDRPRVVLGRRRIHPPWVEKDPEIAQPVSVVSDPANRQSAMARRSMKAILTKKAK